MAAFDAMKKQLDDNQLERKRARSVALVSEELDAFDGKMEMNTRKLHVPCDMLHLLIICLYINQE